MNPEDLIEAAKIHERRRKRFLEEGLTEEQAFKLADHLFERDRFGDYDLRVCFECKNYKDKEKVCTKTVNREGKMVTPFRFILQRCPEFDYRRGKNVE
jgi:hypothetical protein